jgi:hypothetical protein
MSLVLWIWLGQAGQGSRWLVAPLGILLGAAVYGGAIWLLRPPEAKGLLAVTRDRIRRLVS